MLPSMYFRVNLKIKKPTVCCCFTWIAYIELNFRVGFLLIRKTWGCLFVSKVRRSGILRNGGMIFCDYSCQFFNISDLSHLIVWWCILSSITLCCFCDLALFNILMILSDLKVWRLNTVLLSVFTMHNPYCSSAFTFHSDLNHNRNVGSSIST